MYNSSEMKHTEKSLLISLPPQFIESSTAAIYRDYSDNISQLPA